MIINKDILTITNLVAFEEIMLRALGGKEEVVIARADLINQAIGALEYLSRENTNQSNDDFEKLYEATKEFVILYAEALNDGNSPGTLESKRKEMKVRYMVAAFNAYYQK